MRNPPKGIKLIREERILEIQWDADDVRRYPIWNLRCDCRCASCVDENTGIRILDIDSVPKDVSITHMKLVGAYSIRFDFSDGHATGLFTWEHLDKIQTAAA